MPVRDLTDRPHRIPRLGKIRLGDRSGRNQAPVNKPYFVVPEEVAQVYGPEPTALRIVFLGDDEEAIASTYYRAYNATNGLVCRGDGHKADALLDADEIGKRSGDLSQPLPLNAWAHGDTASRGGATKRIVRQQIDCPGAGYNGSPACPAFVAKKCAVRGFFQFAVYGVPGLGIYQMDTGSVVNIDRILGVMEMTRRLVGGVAGVPMILRRVQSEVAPDGIKKKVWTVELQVDTHVSLPEILKLRQGPVAQALLPPPDESEVYEAVEEEEEPIEARVEAVEVDVAGPVEAAPQAPVRAQGSDYEAALLLTVAETIGDEKTLELIEQLGISNFVAFSEQGHLTFMPGLALGQRVKAVKALREALLEPEPLPFE